MGNLDFPGEEGEFTEPESVGVAGKQVQPAGKREKTGGWRWEMEKKESGKDGSPWFGDMEKKTKTACVQNSVRVPLQP